MPGPMHARSSADALDRAAPGAHLALALLTLAYVLSYVDRTILTLLVGPIRADLGISDTQFSLLHGLAFALFYTVLGVPIGRLADRGDRRRIIAVGVFVWSLMTALCGLARGFGALFAARAGVGVGEAALSPAAYSLISDLYPKRSAGRALGVYGAGVYVGIGATFAGGGWLVARLAEAGPRSVPLVGTMQPWQQAFLLVGLPGVLLALAIWRLLPEPRRAARGAEPSPRAVPPDSGLRPYLRRSWPFLLLHFAGFSMLTIAFNGYLAWTPEYFLRAHGWDKATTGLWLGLIIILAGAGGMLLGGAVTDILAARGDRRASMTAALFGTGLLLPWPLWATFQESAVLALAGLVPIVFFSSFCFGPAVVALQQEAPPGVRGQVAALYLFVVNLAGIGFGGTAVALVSDYLLRDEARIGEAMAFIGAPAAFMALMFVVFARRQLGKDRQGAG